MESGKRSRGKNFSRQERELLIQCVKPFVKIIECSETNKKSNEKKDCAWEEVAKNFNAEASEPRNAKSLKSCYQQFKMTVKKENASFKRETFGTGGGCAPKQMEAASIQMLSLLGSQTIPLDNKFDSGADYHSNTQLSEEKSIINSQTLETEMRIGSQEINVTEDNNNEIEEIPIIVSVESNITRPSFKRKRQSGGKSFVSTYAEAKHERMEHRSKYEDELVEIKKDYYLKQNELIDKQIEAADLDVKIKHKQMEIEELRLKKFKSD